jgi:dTDP-4-dehydrorhamnose 3,5-epimerase
VSAVSELAFEPTPIAGVQVVRRTRRADARGFLARLFSVDAFAQAGAPFAVAQVNHTCTRVVGAVRGLHYQRAPHADTKLVTCVRGAVFDVAVDLRRGSATFLRWFGLRLDAADDAALLIPAGCAHGFQVLDADAELIYLHTAAYTPLAEGAVHPQDPRVAVAWPQPIALLSERDASHPPLAADFEGLVA